MHAQDLGTEDDLVGRAQELSHLDGPRLAIFLALPTESRAREPPGGRGERACRVPAEQGGQRRMKLVGVHPTRCAQHVRGVLRASARWDQGQCGQRGADQRRADPGPHQEEVERGSSSGSLQAC